MPVGQTVPAFLFPAAALPVVDGDLGDWGAVPASYAIDITQFRDLVGDVDADPGDFRAVVMVGWSAAANRLFIAARVEDDIHQVDRPAGSAASRIFQDDALEVFIDADHSGGQYADFTDLPPDEALQRNGSSASHFVLAGPPPDDDFFVNFSAASWYAIPDGPYTQAAVDHGLGEDGMATTTYELALTPFDLVDVDAVFLSREHRLEAGQILGFNVELNDFDVAPELYEAKWSLSGGYNAFRFADRFSDLMLVADEGIFASGVEASSWARIKAALQPRSRP